MQVDIIGGIWFGRTKWVKLLFRERFGTLESGEDYHWCHNIGKYLNIRCYVMPFDVNDYTFNGVSPDYIAISDRGDSTNEVCAGEWLFQTAWPVSLLIITYLNFSPGTS
jgi:hypothetical protein